MIKTTSPSPALQKQFPNQLEVVKPTTPVLATSLVLQPTKDEAGLNKLETAWLAVLRERGADWLGIQPIGLKLGDNCRYHPDFVTLNDGKLTAWETKGFMRDDAALKLKIAARNYPFIRFVLVTKEKKQWVEKEISP